MQQRILYKNMYDYVDFCHIKLTDIVLIFSNALNWCIIPLEIVNSYPIIHDYHVYKREPISICTISNTMICCIVKGSIESIDYDENMIIKTNNQNISLVDIDKKDKFEIRIDNMRNILAKYRNIKYLVPKEKTKNNNFQTLLSEPIAYIIDYDSSENKNKYTIVTSQNNDMTKINEYLETMYYKIKERNGFCSFGYLSTLQSLYPNNKIIYFS